MKVWVVVGGWNYEGLAEPVGVFSTEELAKAAEAAAYPGYDFKQILVYELDQAKD